MAATNIIQRQLFELFCRHLCEVVCDGTREGLKNFKAGLIQASWRPFANTTDHDTIDCQACESSERLTVAVGVPFVTVCVLLDLTCFESTSKNIGAEPKCSKTWLTMPWFCVVGKQSFMVMPPWVVLCICTLLPKASKSQ